ncbi:pilus assembly protein TadG-related protein [Aeromicrobium sp. CF3.5]|uniref:pilus assembly protein TadG-related protein n=1 Tax=Aeromicrobium sp. CF3.5 TaxID=3373078 RepID=UPI003EE7CDA5
MRCLTARAERGVVAVMFAVAAPMLIAAVGLSVDVGNLVLQNGSVQKAADSAALAIGQDCARATRQGATSTQLQRCTPAGALATAQLMVAGNATGSSPSMPSSLTPGQGTMSLTVSKSVPMSFAAIVGVEPRTVTASSTVAWGQVPTAATTMPLTLDTCDFNAWRLNPTSERKLYRYDAAPRFSQTEPITCEAPDGGTNTSIGGALWVGNLDSPGFDASTCLASTALGPNNGKIFPQKYEFPQSCTDRMNALVPGKTYLMAIGEHDGWSGWGTTLWPRVGGYAPFVITGWRLGDQNTVRSSHLDPSAPPCTGSCRGIQGYFTGWVGGLEGIDSYGTDPNADFGSIRVKLTS